MVMIDTLTSNELLERAGEVIIVPTRDDIVIKDPEVYLKRLAELETPRERLLAFAKSLFYLRSESTHESRWIQHMTVFGTLVGWLYGGTIASKDIAQDYIRNHNAAVFDSDHLKKRHYLDNMAYGSITRGAKYGLRTGLLLGSTGIISLGSINYRNKLYFPDWLVGFGSLGAISRLWLGPKAMCAGALFGSAAGMFGYGVARCLELATGHSATQFRYLWHEEFLKREEAKLEERRRVRRDYERRYLHEKAAGTSI